MANNIKVGDRVKSRKTGCVYQVSSIQFETDTVVMFDVLTGRQSIGFREDVLKCVDVIQPSPAPQRIATNAAAVDSFQAQYSRIGDTIIISSGPRGAAGFPTSSCAHSWKTYHGFTETYDYCTKCDAKKEQNA